MNKRQRKKVFKAYGRWLPLPDMRVDGVIAKTSFFSLGAYSHHRSATRIIKEHMNIDPVINPYIYRIVY